MQPQEGSNNMVDWGVAYLEHTFKNPWWGIKAAARSIWATYLTLLPMDPVRKSSLWWHLTSSSSPSPWLGPIPFPFFSSGVHAFLYRGNFGWRLDWVVLGLRLGWWQSLGDLLGGWVGGWADVGWLGGVKTGWDEGRRWLLGLPPSWISWSSAFFAVLYLLRYLLLNTNASVFCWPLDIVWKNCWSHLFLHLPMKRYFPHSSSFFAEPWVSDIPWK